MKYAYYGHHKCATGWTNSIIRELCFHLGLRHRTAHGPQQYGSLGGLRQWCTVQNVEFLAYTNARIENVNGLNKHRGFHVVRDPRDILVSAYFSHRNSHPTKHWPELEKHREVLQSLPKEEGLLREIHFSKQFLEPMLEWNYSQDHILELKMEELTQQPMHHFRRVLDHMALWRESPSVAAQLRQKANRVIYALHHRVPGDSVPHTGTVEEAIEPSIFNAILNQHTFKKMANGRAKGESNPNSHYRKGEAGDWKNHFTDKVVSVFEREYGDIVVRLGYE